jgi:hypothetical protein
LKIVELIIIKLIFINIIYKNYNMKLRNSKIIKFKSPKKQINQKKILIKSANLLPFELLNIISSFCFCKICYINKEIHCNHCNYHNVNKKLHLTCKKCNLCYSKYITIHANSVIYNNVINLHIHCEKCKSIKKYSMKRFNYYCSNCHNM